MSNLANQFDLKDEKQAQEYLDTLKVEYSFQCHKENEPGGCHRLADFLEAFEKNIKEAFKIYSMNCDKNDYGHSCFKKGSYQLLGRECDKSYSDALVSYSKACDRGYGPGCFQAGRLEESETLGRNYSKAFKFLEKGCELNHMPSCNMYSIYNITGKKGVPRDMDKAFKAAYKACEKDHIVSCVNLSQMYRKGDGVEVSIENAEKFKQKAIDLKKRMTEIQPDIKFGE